MTAGSDDVLDGAAGTDLFNVTVGDTGTVQATISNIETVKATFSAAGTVSMLSSTDVTSIINNNSTVAAIFTNISDATTALTAQNTAVGSTFTYTDAAMTGSSDNVAITLSNVTAGTLTIQPASATNGAETITITSSGSANTLAAIDDGTSTSLKKLVVVGDVALTLTAITPTTVTTVDASAMTAALTMTDTSTLASVITTGSGADVITMSNTVTADSITAGAGNDTVTFSTAGNFTITDTVAGGDGTDVLIVTAADAVGYTVLDTPLVTDFETLRLSTALTTTLTTANIDVDIVTLTLAVAGANTAAVVNFSAGTSKVNIGSSSSLLAELNTSLTVDAAGSLGTDSVTIDNNNAVGSTVDAFNATTDLVFTDYETVTIDTGIYTTTTAQQADAVTITGSSGFTSAETLMVTGSNPVTFGIVTADVIDASGMTVTTGTMLTLVTATTATTITGSDGNDVLISDVALANVSISGGAGLDTITGGTGNDTLDGGAGIDSIVGAGGNDVISAGAGNDTVNISGASGNSSIDAGAGNDTITFGAFLTTGDTVDGGDGTDTLSVTDTSLAALNALSLNAVVTQNALISNVEAVIFSDDLDETSFDMARLDSLTTITVTDWAASAQALIGLAAATTVNLTAVGTTNAANDLTLTYADATGSSDSLTINLINDESSNFGDVTIAAIESLTITHNEDTASTTVNTGVFDLTATGLTTLTITGTDTLNLSGVAITATTIDASGITDTGTAPAVSLLGGSTAQSITGSAGVDTINGGSGADTIVGGASGDSLVGGTGADSITGGAGADTITGGSGNDIIVLTETTGLVDDVILDYSEAGAYIDKIYGFTTGTSGDEIQLDLSALEALSTAGGIDAAAINFTILSAAVAVTAAAGVVTTVTGAITTPALNNIFILDDTTFGDESEVETALEDGGTFEMTTVAGTDIVNNAFIVVYTDGTDTFVAVAYADAVTNADTEFESGDLNVVNIAQIMGLSSYTSGTTLTAANFEWIA